MTVTVLVTLIHMLLSWTFVLIVIGCAKKSAPPNKNSLGNPQSSRGDKDSKAADSKKESDSKRNPWEAVKVPVSEQQESTDLHTLSAFKDNGDNKKPQNFAVGAPGAAPAVHSEAAMEPNEKRVDKGNGIVVNREGQPISHFVDKK